MSLNEIATIKANSYLDVVTVKFNGQKRLFSLIPMLNDEELQEIAKIVGIKHTLPRKVLGNAIHAKINELDYISIIKKYEDDKLCLNIFVVLTLFLIFMIVCMFICLTIRTFLI